MGWKLTRIRAGHLIAIRVDLARILVLTVRIVSGLWNRHLKYYVVYVLETRRVPAVDIFDIKGQ